MAHGGASPICVVSNLPPAQPMRLTGLLPPPPPSPPPPSSPPPPPPSRRRLAAVRCRCRCRRCHRATPCRRVAAVAAWPARAARQGAAAAAIAARACRAVRAACAAVPATSRLPCRRRGDAPYGPNEPQSPLGQLGYMPSWSGGLFFWPIFVIDFLIHLKTRFASETLNLTVLHGPLPCALTSPVLHKSNRR